MTEGIKPIRRVVTGNDEQGRSCVLYDSAAPNVNANAFKKGTAMTDVWVFQECPAVISGRRDDGSKGRSRWCSTRRKCAWLPETPSCSGAPATHGATARASLA